MALGIISCHWNPAGFVSLRKNWHTWRRTVDGLGVPVVSVELSYDGTFHTTSEVKLKGEQKHVLWQKECLLNIALKALPADVDRVVWADADIWFDEADWLDRVDKALDVNPLVQCFQWIRYHGNDGGHSGLFPSSAYNFEAHFDKSKPGGIWSAHRDLFGEEGFYDRLISGSGDVAIMLAAIGSFVCPWSQRQAEALRKHWLRWGAGFYRKVRKRVGWANCTANHMYHGAFKNRRYNERDYTLNNLKFDPEKDIAKDEQGLLYWTDDAPACIVDTMQAYFAGREEDDQL